MDDINNGWDGPSNKLHVVVRSFDFTKKKYIRVELLQLLKNIWISDLKQKLRWINTTRDIFNLEIVSIFCLSCLPYLFYELTTYLYETYSLKLTAGI